MISLAVYPKILSAPLFQLWMMPFRFLLRIASSDDSTMAAKRSRSSEIVFSCSVNSEAGRASAVTSNDLFDDLAKVHELTERHRLSKVVKSGVLVGILAIPNRVGRGQHN